MIFSVIFDELIEHDSNLTAGWFDFNFMKLSQYIYDHMIPEHWSESIWAKIWVMKICVSKHQKLLNQYLRAQS